MSQDKDGGQSHEFAMEFTFVSDLLFLCSRPSTSVDRHGNCPVEFVDCQNLNKDTINAKETNLCLKKCLRMSVLTDVLVEEPFFHFPLSQDLATYSKPERSVLSIYWYPSPNPNGQNLSQSIISAIMECPLDTWPLIS